MNIGSRPDSIERNTRYAEMPLTAPLRAIGKCHKARRDRVINIRFRRRNSTVGTGDKLRDAHALRNYARGTHASVIPIDRRGKNVRHRENVAQVTLVALDF